MELRHLRSFVTVAEERHFGRAAKKLHISQPPLSNQIKQLERELGTELLARTTHGVALTHVGRVFLNEARKVLSQAERAMGEAQRAMRGESGSVLVGFVVPVVTGVLPPALRLFQDRFPRARVELAEHSTASGLAALNAAELDAALVFAPLDGYSPAEVIFRDPWLVAVPAAHRLSSKRVVRREDLRDEPVVTASRRDRPAIFDRTIAWFDQGGIVPRIAQEVPTLHALVGLVACGAGLGLVPRSCRSLKLDGVAYRPLREQLPPLEVVVAWRADSTSPLVDGFIAAAREAAAKVAREGART